MLLDSGIAADHYNAQTSAQQRQDILSSFQRREVHGGVRVLVTVDVLSEGVDLPVADTCLFVAPRRGIRLRQCVGRVLRNHPEKVDAAWLVGVLWSLCLSTFWSFLYIHPDMVQNSFNFSLAVDTKLQSLGFGPCPSHGTICKPFLDRRSRA